MLRTPDTDADAGADEPGLSVGVHTRISPAADEMMKERAKGAGVKPATWVRIKIYEALGLLKVRGQRANRGKRGRK